MKKITVIIPVYNVEQYIRKCLDSLICQDYDNFEVLVINDGSPYNEQVIIDEYAKKYPFIKSIVKENGGYGSALELAIKEVKTPFILVCDPDDYLYPYSLKELASLQEINDSDITIGAKTLIFSDNNEEKYDKSFNDAYANLIDKKCYLKDDEDFNDLYFIDPSPHSKLYRVELLKETVFPHKVSFTDNILYFCALNRAQKVLYTNKPYAYYLINRVGNTMSDIKPKAIDAEALVLCENIKQNKNAKDIFYYRMFEAYKYIINDKINHVSGSNEEKKEKLLRLYGVINELLPYKKAILKYYKKYNKYKIIEKYKDRLLLNKISSKLIYKNIINKKLRSER